MMSRSLHSSQFNTFLPTFNKNRIQLVNPFSERHQQLAQRQHDHRTDRATHYFFLLSVPSMLFAGRIFVSNRVEEQEK